MLAVDGFASQVIPDTRPPFEKLNRMSLYYLLWANGIESSDSLPKDHLVKIADLHKDELLTQGPNGTYAYKNVNAYKDIFGAIVIQRPAEHAAVYEIKDPAELAEAIKSKPKPKQKQKTGE